jgi:inward rectifier potassium channel
MTKPSSTQNQINDPGFGEKVGGASRRIINKDGSFNIQRVGGEGGFRNLYQHLMQLSNGMFFLVVLGGFIFINIVFACLYFLVGPEHLIGVRGESPIEHFLDCFYFSAQTFTTVGYGAIAPRGVMASTLASLEALLGLLSLAIATGLLYTRFSRPKAKLRFSDKAVVAPFEEGNALMFRFVNARSNVLMNLTAQVILTMRETADPASDRKYYGLELTIKEVMFLAMTWTLVHKINDKSKLNGLTHQDLLDRGAEILILVSGYDDTFSQTIHTRYSYAADEIVWGAKFVKAFTTDEKGVVKMDLNNIDLITEATLNS